MKYQVLKQKFRKWKVFIPETKDAAADKQSGVTSTRKRCPVEKADLTLDEIISSLEDQAQDRDCFVDEDDPDCIFRHNAAALRAAAALLRKMEDPGT